MKKRIITVAVLFTLVTGTLAGCGGGSGKRIRRVRRKNIKCTDLGRGCSR